MGLIDVLTRAAGSRAHVLVAEVPGAFRERVAEFSGSGVHRPGARLHDRASLVRGTPTAAEVEHAGFRPGPGVVHADGRPRDQDGRGRHATEPGHGDPSADGHQYDGRHAVVGNELRDP